MLWSLKYRQLDLTIDWVQCSLRKEVIRLINPSKEWTEAERLKIISAILDEECPRQGPGLNCDLAELPASEIREIGERIYFLANKASSLLESQRDFVLGRGEKKT